MDGIWYVVGFAFAGVSFVFLTIGAAWLISHRNRGQTRTRACRTRAASTRTATPTAGSACRSTSTPCCSSPSTSRSIFIFLWALVFRDLILGRLSSAWSSSSAILLLGLAYAWRKGVLTWR